MHKRLIINTFHFTVIRRFHNYDLSGRNTFRMKVRCALFVEVTEEADLPALDWDALPRPVMVMGGGSNLLFTGDFPGTVLHVGIGHSEFKGPSDPFCHSERSEASVDERSAPTDPSSPSAPQDDRNGAPGDERITLGAGVVFDEFCAWAASRNLWGPENLSLIPGEVGASAVQNIGAYGVEAKDIIAGIRAWDRVERRFVDIDPADCAYGYRTSKFKTEWKGRYIITAVTYRLSRTPRPRLDYGGVRKALIDRGLMLTPQVVRDTIIGIRRAKLPAVEEVGSAGSFFCNPVISREHFAQISAIARSENGPKYQVPHYEVEDRIKVPAAWMIDQCGLKGRRNGGAQVYPTQPLVIVNASGTATPEDIIDLEKQIIDTIAGKYGITLHPEVEHV